MQLSGYEKPSFKFDCLSESLKPTNSDIARFFGKLSGIPGKTDSCIIYDKGFDMDEYIQSCREPVSRKSTRFTYKGRKIDPKKLIMMWYFGITYKPNQKVSVRMTCNNKKCLNPSHVNIHGVERRYYLQVLIILIFFF